MSKYAGFTQEQLLEVLGAEKSAHANTKVQLDRTKVALDTSTGEHETAQERILSYQDIINTLRE